MKFKYFFTLVLFCFSSIATAIESIPLTDVIKSNGKGSIDLLSDLSPADLELLRLSNDGNLVFAIDVNEAANGTEKASTQGLSIKSIELRIVIDQNIVIYELFSTRTKSLLAETGSTVRKEYYTLLGEAGSSRESSGNAIQSVFDSTLKVPVDIALDNVSSAVLNLNLLETNTTLGDPEAFYDFSNGAEDIAIVNSADAFFIDNYRAGVAEAPLVIEQNNLMPAYSGWIHYPSSDSYYIVAYEDLFPALGDYDFNDLTVAYQVSFGLNSDGEISGISGQAFLLTRGAAYDHDWYLRIALPDTTSGQLSLNVNDTNNKNINSLSTGFNGDLLIKGFTSTLTIFSDPQHNMVNTFPQTEFILSPRLSFSAQLDQPVSMDTVANPPFDPFIFVHDTGFEIHLSGQLPSAQSNNWAEGLTEFRDENGFPFAMLLPTDWKPPYAGINISNAYPQFEEFVNSQGSNNTEWFLNPDVLNVLQVLNNQWQW